MEFGINKFMNCKICNGQTENIFTQKVLSKYDVKYFSCIKCGYLCTEEPYWLEEAYKSPINLSDTGMLQRNIEFSKITSILLFSCFNRQGKFIDYAGGYGIFTRLMRDIGFDYFWYDPYCENLFAKNNEAGKNPAFQYELLTAFESFEHFINPLYEVEKMLSFSDNILFSTELIPASSTQFDNWWYFGFEHGQHISFYTITSLDYIAKKFGLKLMRFGNLFLFTRRNISKTALSFFYKLQLPIFLVLKKRMKSLTDADFQLSKRKGD